MIVVRALLALLVAPLLALTTTAYSVQQTLTQPEVFVASMDGAAQSPAVQAELQSEIRRQVRVTLERVAPDRPLAVALDVIGRDAIADTAAAATGSEVFRSAWHDWSLLLYDGIVDRARGTPNDQVTVGRRQVTVAVAPLITPVLGDTLAGGVAGALDLFDADSTVTVGVGFPIGRALTEAGRLAEWRWGLAAVTAGVLFLLLAASYRRPWLWLAIAGVVAGLSCGLAGAAVRLGQSQPPPGSEFPQLGLALTNALTDQWDSNLFTVALACAVVAVLGFLLDAVTRRRRRHVRTAGGRAAP